MKKVSAFFFASILLFLLTSCGGNENKGFKDNSGVQQENDTHEVVTAYKPMDFDSLPDNPSSDFDYYLLYETLFINGYKGSSKVVKIPPVIDGNEVKIISESAFSGSDITHIYIPDTVLEIQASCFSGCSELKEVRLSEKIFGINKATFYECSSLVKVDIPDSVKYISGAAFNSCKSMKEFVAPSSLWTIGERAFAYSGYERIDLSTTNNLDNMEQFAFDGCKSLKSVVFPGVMDMQIDDMYGAFNECYNLSEFSVVHTDNTKQQIVTIKDNVLYCGSFALSAAPANPVVNITLKDGTTAVGPFAFAHSNIESISFPDSCKEIKKGAFKYCNNLKKINFGNGIEDIGYMSFSECYSLDEVVLPKSVRCIDDEAFGYTKIKKAVINSVDLSESEDFFDVFKWCEDISVIFKGKTFTKDRFAELNAMAGIEV